MKQNLNLEIIVYTVIAITFVLLNAVWLFLEQIGYFNNVN
jgi:hypothetical protein